MDELMSRLQERLGHKFKDPRLLQQALTHSSACTEQMPSNERLEFLGDAVIGMVVSERLFKSMPEATEGEMTLIKSAAVSRALLAKVGRALGLAECLRVDEGLRQSRPYPPSIVGNAYEAVIGAVFLDGGLARARKAVMRTLGRELDNVRQMRHEPSYKSILQQLTQAEGKGTPRYSIVESEGPQHQRRFRAVVRIGRRECGTGWGNTKKDAEQNAAHQALDSLYPGWSATGAAPDSPSGAQERQKRPSRRARARREGSG